MTEFQIVSDELRERRTNRGGRGQPSKPEYEALKSGQTVFFPLNGADRWRLSNRIRSAMKYYDLTVTVRTMEVEGVPGVLAWLVKADSDV